MELRHYTVAATLHTEPKDISPSIYGLAQAFVRALLRTPPLHYIFKTLGPN